jgi:hemerythrin superfamily protein
MNAITLLDRQHDEVAALFKKVEATHETAKREALFIRIADALAAHATIEETIFYPAVRAKRTEDILLESLEEHLGIKRLITDLLQLDASDERYPAKLKVLREQVEHHVGEERTDLFPKVKRLFDGDQLEALGQQMEARTCELEGSSPRLGVPAESKEAAPL